MKLATSLNAVAFPTCVGMNRASLAQLRVVRGVPHVRGDEPAVMLLGTPE